MDSTTYMEIACNRPKGCHALWVSPDFYFDLQECGMVTFEWGGRIAMFMGLELRPVEEMDRDWKFAAD